MSNVRPAVDARWRDTSKQIGRWSPEQQQAARAYQLAARFLQESAFVNVRSILAFDPRHNPTQGAAAAGWDGRRWMGLSDGAAMQLHVQGKDQWVGVGRIPKGWGIYEMPSPPFLAKWKVAVWLYDNSTMSQSAICEAIGLDKSALTPGRLGRKFMNRSWVGQAPAPAVSRLEGEPRGALRDYAKQVPAATADAKLSGVLAGVGEITHPKGRALAELVAATGFSVPVVARSLGRLEAEGLVEVEHRNAKGTHRITWIGP